MNLLVTILSLTPAVGAMLRLLEEKPAASAPSQMHRLRDRSRRRRARNPRKKKHSRLAVWRSREMRNPLRALRAP